MSEEKELSKSELRAQKRAEKQKRKAEEEARAKKDAFRQNIFTWGLVAILGVGLVLFVGSLLSNNDSNLGGVQEVVVTDDDWIKGNPEAAVTLVEYGDFMCPGCAAAHGQVERILADSGDDVRFVFRNYPILGPKSLLAARVAEAAGAQGKFFEMYDLMFQNQNEWSRARNTDEIFNGYAEELGLDMEAYEAALTSREVADRVSDQLAVGRSLGVSSTPTFFLNGQKMTFSNYNQFEELIREAVEDSESESGALEVDSESVTE